MITQIHEPFSRLVLMNPGSLLVFIDETGGETYADKHNPVFGFAGCAILAADYEKRLAKHWRELKRTALGLEGKPFHAVEFSRSLGLDPQKQSKIAAINQFLTRPLFRFAVVTDGSTSRPIAYDAHQAIVSPLCHIVGLVARLVALDSITLIFSHSHRGSPLVIRTSQLASGAWLNNRRL